MEATYERGAHGVTAVFVGGDARQRLYDSGGFGEAVEGGVRLSLVEAAYLLREGKLDAVEGDGYAEVAGLLGDDADLRVYTDLRGRGYYLDHGDRVLYYDRGDHPLEASPAGAVVAVGESEAVDLSEARDASLLAVADDDGDVTYLSVDDGGLAGDHDAGGAGEAPVDTEVRAGRVVVPDGETAGRLSEEGYGVEGDGGLALSDVEAAYLSRRGVIDPPDGEVRTDEEVVEVYSDLRGLGVLPRTGFKFGAEFRVYETRDDDHAPYLVSTVDGPVVSVRWLSRYVRLAHGVRKTALLAVVDEDVRYLSVERRRP